MDIHLFKPGNKKMGLARAQQKLETLIKELEEQAQPTIVPVKVEPNICYWKQKSDWDSPITEMMCYTCDGQNKDCKYYMQNTK